MFSLNRRAMCTLRATLKQGAIFLKYVRYTEGFETFGTPDYQEKLVLHQLLVGPACGKRLVGFKPVR